MKRCGLIVLFVIGCGQGRACEDDISRQQRHDREALCLKRIVSAETLCEKSGKCELLEKLIEKPNCGD